MPAWGQTQVIKRGNAQQRANVGAGPRWRYVENFHDSLARVRGMNDKYGHKAGDYYLQGCCQLICKIFRHSPVYRIGGDEFVVIVENQDYTNRRQRFEELEKAFEISYKKDTSIPWEKLSAACGMAELSSDDNTAELVFKRADKHMYENKTKFKMQHGSYR